MITGAAAVALATGGLARAADASDQSTNVSEVVITGSRLPVKDFQAVSPVTTVNSQQLQLTGTVAVQELLNELPQVVPGNTITSNNSGGENFATVDLRGLGVSRTLVVINGERVPGSSTTGAVDLNTIPVGLIDRIEVLTGGASAVYGSDAMAGVVNFILKKDFHGVEINGLYGSNFDGKAPEWNINALIGSNFADGKGNITVYGDYYERRPVLQSAFPWSAISAGVFEANGTTHVIDTAAKFYALRAANGNVDPGAVVPAGSGTPPWGWITNDATNKFQNLNTNAATSAQFAAADTDCNPATPPVAVKSSNLSFNDNDQLTPRFTSGACNVADRAAGSSRYSFNAINDIIIPARRFGITSVGHYDFSDYISTNFYLQYVDSQTGVQLAPTPATGLTIVLTPATLAYIQANHADLAAALASRPRPLANFVEDWRSLQLGPRIGIFDNNSLIILNTLQGKITDKWDWSFTTSYGQNHFTQTLKNNLNKTAIEEGLAGCQVPIAFGQPGAGTPLGLAGLPGCALADIYGQGKLSDAAVSFLRTDIHALTQTYEARVAGFVRGDAFDLPAGPLATVVGFEWRRDHSEFTPDDEQVRGNIYGFNAVQAQKGTIDVGEAYIELGVPLLKDMPFANFAGLEAGYRYSDYSTIHGVSTYKIGGTWNPVSWLKFRAIYNQAVRAPNVFELFQNGDQGFPAYTDPCNATAHPSAALQAFCVAQGVPAASISTFLQNNSQVQAFAFGNPNLKPETGKTWTAGSVLQPDHFWLGALRTSVDYYNIDISNAILARGAQTIIGSCYNGLSAANPDCLRIVRDPSTGQITSVDTSRGNLSALKTEGVDTQVDWSVELDDIYRGVPGRLQLNELFSYLISFKQGASELAGTTEAAINTAFPQYKSVFTAYYTLEPVTAFIRWSYVPGMTQIDFPAVLGAPKTPAASYVDLSARWDINKMFQVTGEIGNIFDEKPPQTESDVLAGQGNTDPQTYRVLGRTFSIQARARF